jgi:hypothetical protein
MDDAATMPAAPVDTAQLTTQGYQYLTETRYGEAEALLDALRRAAEGMGLAARSMEIEMGPSQYEFTFDPSDPMAQADRAVLFRTLVKEVCQQRGAARAVSWPSRSCPTPRRTAGTSTSRCRMRATGGTCSCPRPTACPRPRPAAGSPVCWSMPPRPAC